VTRGEALLVWYRASARDLPWRHTSDPYRILVSEVMLQQTQAERVVPRYEHFVARFPTVGALAGAPLADVLEAWSGLGYNVRARRLRDAARRIAAEGWPTTPDGLRALPGVGPYTAAAVAAFAFGCDVPAIDTNVRRVVSRWAGRPLQGATLQHIAAEVMEGDPAHWNQAMMELGATLCGARSPRCDDCPVDRWCADPTVYEPPPRQGRFEGSARQIRGAVLRALARRWASIETIQASIGLGAEEVGRALASLAADGLVEVSKRSARLAP
jgi:A/G-specific adenine glycosylase